MAKFTIELSDEAVEHYKFYGVELAKPVEAILQLQLQKWAEVNPMAKYLLIPDEVRRMLEERTTGLPLSSSEDLVERFERLCSLKVGEIRLRWHPGQVVELRQRAERAGLEINRYFELCVRRVLEEQILNFQPRVGEMLEAQAQQDEARGAVPPRPADVGAPGPAPTRPQRVR